MQTAMGWRWTVRDAARTQDRIESAVRAECDLRLYAWQARRDSDLCVVILFITAAVAMVMTWITLP